MADSDVLLEVNGTITTAGNQYIAMRQASLKPVIISHFVLAHIPGVDETTPADPEAGLPDNEFIVADNVDYIGPHYRDKNTVVYSVMLGSEVGDFDFNWYGAVTDTGILLSYLHIPLTKKRVGIGQILTRNMMMVFSAAKALTGANIPAEAWQFDFDRVMADGLVSLTGPKTVFAGGEYTFNIVDFDEFSRYSVSATPGTASISGTTITLNVPPSATDAGVCKLTITRNGLARVINLDIGASGIVTPRITAPANGAKNVTLTPTFSMSTFTTSPAGADTAKAVSYRVLDPVGDVVWEALNTPVGTAPTVPSDTLKVSTTYRVQGQYIGHQLTSAWSELTSFKTTVQEITYGSIIDGDTVVGAIDGDWLLVAPPQYYIKKKWGALVNTPLINIDNSDPGRRDPNTGKYNTKIISQMLGESAAKYCLELTYDLPNRQELEKVIINRELIDLSEIDAEINSSKTPPTSGKIWTSTEFSGNMARFVSLYNGGGSGMRKDIEAWVVPTRRIPI